MRCRVVLFLLCFLPTLQQFLLSPAQAQPEPQPKPQWEFGITFSKEVHPQPYTGRVYVMFSRHRREPRTGPNWFQPEQFLSVDVKNWQPETQLTISPTQPEKLLAYPVPLSEMNLKGVVAQAVIRFNPHHREVGLGSGNGYSKPVALGNVAQTEMPVRFHVDQVVSSRQYPDNRWCNLFEVRSQRLSEFRKYNVFLRSTVTLPASYYESPNRRYPVIFTIPGFGGTHLSGYRSSPVPENNQGGVEFIRVTLDPSCPRGHHVFANSANNGPVGDALVKEFLPEFDRRFRTIPKSTARFLTGHSSGGWSSLWLQVTYPDVFGGTWSTAPDPVDFRDFQRIHIYRQGENMYRDPLKNRRPLARHSGRVLLWYDNFAKMEWVLGYGGQLHSFEAVFSEQGEDGNPRELWNRATGEIDREVAESWKKYDIRLILEENQATLGPKLKGKLNVFMGTEDTFYLEGATQLLKESQAKLGTDAVIEMIPGRDHSNLLTGALRSRIRREMTAKFLQHHGPKPR